MTRKSPIRHKVRSHKREGKPVRSFSRGKGTNPRSQRRSRVVKLYPAGRERDPAFPEEAMYRTPKQEFERLSIDNILKCVTFNRSILPKLEMLRERESLENEIQKIDDIIANLTEINDELLEIKSAVETRGEQPPLSPIGFRDESELDARTATKSLVKATGGTLHTSRQSLERAKGTMRNIRAKALEGKRASEAEDIGREVKRLTKIGMEIRNIQDTIGELAAGVSEE